MRGEVVGEAAMGGGGGVGCGVWGTKQSVGWAVPIGLSLADRRGLRERAACSPGSWVATDRGNLDWAIGLEACAASIARREVEKQQL